MLTSSIVLTIIIKLDTSRPIGIFFRPFANSVRHTKNHKWCYIGIVLIMGVKGWGGRGGCHDYL